MANRRVVVFVIGTALVMLGVLVAVPLWLRSRPDQVPPGAIRVPIGSRGGWAHCWVDPSVGLNRCDLYNSYGERIPTAVGTDGYDDVYLPYDGRSAIPAAELTIDPDRSNGGFISLKNGGILIPRNNYEAARKHVDELRSLRATGK